MILFLTNKNSLSTKLLEELRSINYEIKYASSYKEAFEILLDNRSIKLIILDIDSINKPKNLLKKIFLEVELPVIYITNNIKKDLKKDLSDLSCYGYISTDSDSFTISSTIKIALNLFKDYKKKKNIFHLFSKAEKISKFGYWEINFND